jgi:TP901 family phage tail tape measure protein
MLAAGTTSIPNCVTTGPTSCRHRASTTRPRQRRKRQREAALGGDPVNALLNITIRVNKQGAQNLTNMQKQIAGMRMGGMSAGAQAAETAMTNFDTAARNVTTTMGGVENGAKRVSAAKRMLTTSTRMLTNGMGRANTSMAQFSGWLQSANHRMASLGKNMQWTGQQLTMRFTLPIVAAIGYGTKLLLDQEAAFVRLEKVYGDGTKTTEEFNKELAVLNEIGLLLSNTYGVAREEINSTMADFAQAGARDTQVANLTKKALELTKVAEMDLAEATQFLIVLQGQYRFNTEELNIALAQLNEIENVTAVRTQQLGAAFVRSGAQFAQWGVSIAEGGAMIAALVPTFRSAEGAGNSLKSMMAALAAPSKAAKDSITALVGATKMQTFETADTMEQFKMLATGLDDVTDAERRHALAVIFGRYQVGAATAVMEQFNNEQSTYNRALAAASDIEKARANYAEELEAVMQSNPQKAAIAWTQLQNTLAEFVSVILPDIMEFLSIVTMLFQEFGKLSDSTRRWILLGAILVATVGPVVAFLGSLLLLVSQLLIPIRLLAQAFLWLIPAIVQATVAMVGFFIAHPWVLMAGIIIATIVLLALAFDKHKDSIMETLGAIRDGVQSFVQFVGDFFVDLFSTLSNVVSTGLQAIGKLFEVGLTALAQFIAGAVKIIYELLSYLNPWAEHSPSLVSQVESGINAIVSKYQELSGVAAPLHRAAAATRNFLAETEGLRSWLEGLGVASQRNALAQFAPGSLGAFDEFLAAIDELEAQLPGLQQAIDAQEQVVADLQAEYDALDATVNAAEDTLSSLESTLEGINDALSQSQARLDDFANAPITGMREMSDAMFANEMAVKALQLAIMDFEDANPQIADLTDQFAKLNGEIEELRSREKELRLAGATADILAPLQAQADALEAQRDAMMSGTGSGPSAELENMRKELERLQREGERLDLENSLKFDPLTRQIEQLVEGMNEMPFDQIVAGIQREQANIISLTAAQDQATAAVNEQRAVVQALTYQRDVLGLRLDAEKQKLSDLEDAYSSIERAIAEMHGSIDALVGDLERAANAAKEAGESALGAAGDFEDAFGSGGPLGAGDGLKGLEELRDELKKKMEEAAIEMKGKLNDIVNTVQNKLNEIRDKVTGFIDVWRDRWNTVANILSYSLIDLLAPTWAWVKGEFDEFVNHIGSGLATMIGWFIEFPMKVYDGIGDVGELLLEKGREIMRGLGRGIYEIALQIFGWLSGMKTTVTSFFKDAITWLVQAGKDIVKGLFDGITKAPYNIAGAILGKLPDIPGFNKGNAIAEANKKYQEEQGQHIGGVVGVDPAQLLRRPFGLRSDEHQRILQRGEMVLTQAQQRMFSAAMSAGSGGGSQITINGNLEFPNITSGDDAEEFIANLESLAATS